MNENIGKLKKKCIDIGFYNSGLEQWFSQFNRSQLFIIDSDSFNKEPAKYMTEIQDFFQLNKTFDYAKRIFYNSTLSVHCLKYRTCASFKNYPPIDDNSNKILEDIYYESKKKIGNLLKSYGIQLPLWLTSIY